jgi:hypothetical protein
VSNSRSHVAIQRPRSVKPQETAVLANQSEGTKPSPAIVPLRDRGRVPVDAPPGSLATDWAGTVVSDTRLGYGPPKPLNVRIKRLFLWLGELSKVFHFSIIH